MGNADDFFDAGVVLKDHRVGGALLPGNADGGTIGAWDGMCLEAHPLDVADDSVDLFRPCAGLHDDKHWVDPFGIAAETAGVLERSQYNRRLNRGIPGDI